MTGGSGLRGYFGFVLLGVSLGGLIAVPAGAEPTFLSKQYPRCTACHYSASGGGLLTPYGRSLSREEISTFGRRDPAAARAPGPRRSSFSVSASRQRQPAAARRGRPALEAADRGRRPRASRPEPPHEPGSAGGLAVRGLDRLRHRGAAPRRWLRLVRTLDRPADLRPGERARGTFLPAYGVRFADHTALSRRQLGLGEDDQVYGVELGLSSDRSLLQLAAGPGRAESLLDDDGRAPSR